MYMEVISLDHVCDGCLKVMDGVDLSSVDEDALFDVAQHLDECTDNEGKLRSEHLSMLQCPLCQKCALIKYEDKFYSISLLLKANHNKDGIHELDEEENPYLLLLMTLCYNGCEREEGMNESPFLASFLRSDVIKLIWNEGQAVGFYVLKVKGSMVSAHPPAVLAVPALDVAYVRRTQRRRGLGRAVLQDVVQHTLGEDGTADLGMTEPVSESMMKVIVRYLTETPRHRDNFWSVTHTGGDGYRKNIWLDQQRLKRLRSE